MVRKPAIITVDPGFASICTLPGSTDLSTCEIQTKKRLARRRTGQAGRVMILSTGFSVTIGWYCFTL